MGKRDPQARFRSAVERHSGAVRALAIAIGDEAATRTSDRERRTREVMEGWSAQLAAIAIALTDAAAELDTDGVRRWSQLASHLAVPLAALAGLVGGLSQGAGQAAFEYVVGDAPAVSACAVEVVGGAQILVVAIEDYERAELAEAVQRHPQRASLRFTVASARERLGDQVFLSAVARVLNRTVTLDEVDEWENVLPDDVWTALSSAYGSRLELMGVPAFED